MKINFTEKIMKDRNDFVMHIILNTMKASVLKELKESRQKEGIVVDVCLTVNGKEIDLESFCEHWQSQVGRMIKEEAVELVKNRFSDVENLMYDLEERLKEEINKRLEDWEKPKKVSKKRGN